MICEVKCKFGENWLVIANFVFLFSPIKLRLMRAELNVEEVVQQRSLKVNYLNAYNILVYQNGQTHRTKVHHI